MLGVTLFGLVFTPVFYLAVRWLTDRLGPAPAQPLPVAEVHLPEPDGAGVATVHAIKKADTSRGG
jgi:hypothetical protein